jgi:hypothetical protein
VDIEALNHIGANLLFGTFWGKDDRIAKPIPLQLLWQRGKSLSRPIIVTPQAASKMLPQIYFPTNFSSITNQDLL